MSKDKLYQEDESSTFGNGMKLYSLNILFKLTKDEPTSMMPIRDLEWIFDPKNNLGKPSKDEAKRVEESDYWIPSLIAKLDGQEVVVDGMHRLKKAIQEGEDHIVYKRVTQSMLKQAEIRHTKESAEDLPDYSFNVDLNQFTLDGKTYSVDAIVRHYLLTPLQQIPLDTIDWVIKGEVDREDYLVFITSMAKPLLVMDYKGKKLIVSNWNELRALQGEGLHTARGYYIDDEGLEAGNVENIKPETGPVFEKPKFSHWH